MVGIRIRDKRRSPGAMRTPCWRRSMGDEWLIAPWVVCVLVSRDWCRRCSDLWCRESMGDSGPKFVMRAARIP